MPRSITASDFPTFAGCVEKSTCISPAPTQNFRRCRLSINSGDRWTASELRERILSFVADTTVTLEDDDLREYAKLSCCVRWHRPQVINESVMGQLIMRWRNELTRQRNERTTATRSSEQPPARAGSNAEQRPVTTRWRGRGDSHDPILLHFEPHETNTPVPMCDLISEPLTGLQKKPGSLYCASRPSDQGFHKAGCTTTRSVAQRIQKLQKCSGTHNAVTLEYSVRTSNAHRAETLLHAELKQYRRDEQYCLDPSCHKKHKEWFEVDVDIIKRAMSLWAQWLNDARPYDEDGRLRRPWKAYCERLRRQGTPITSSELYLAFSRRLVVNEDENDDDSTSEESSEDDSTDEDAVLHATAEASFAQGESNSDVCAICLDTITNLARTTCGHEFCSECIANWLGAHNRCPMCRTALVEGELTVAEEAEIPMQNTAADLG